MKVPPFSDRVQSVVSVIRRIERSEMRSEMRANAVSEKATREA